MAGNDLLTNQQTMLATPNTASVVYNFDTQSNVRPRGLFFIRFRRPLLGGGDNWRQGHGFVAKAVDMPSVQPVVEELSQYGKKRIIHTGVKYNPITLTFFDTVDSKANQLWNEYSRYYFGDFNHANASAWRDDLVSKNMIDEEKTGFGYKSPIDSVFPDGLNSQFFFESLEIFQVYGGYFVQTDIINPKISNYEPDGLDYEDLAPLTVRMSLTYEAIVYRFGGKPQPLSKDAGLYEAFSKEFSGNVFNPDLGYTPDRPFSRGSTDTDAFLSSTIRDLTTGTNLGDALLRNIKQTVVQKSGVTGGLGRFGDFSFGSLATQVLNGQTVTSTIPRSQTKGNSLFDKDEIVAAVLGQAGSRNLKVNDQALNVANALSNGTVQLGKRLKKTFGI